MKVVLFLSRALLLLPYFHVIDAVSNLYQCPTNGTKPVEITVGTNVGGSTNATIAMSTSCTLCLLVRISSLTGNVSSLSMQDWNMAPVARSYLNYSWENVAGPYVDRLKITCTATNCTLNIPHLADAPVPSHYVLLATNRQVSTKEQVARFLEQVTFGPTLEDVNKFNLSSNLSDQFTQWVKKQMDPSVITPTYHREFFRARVDNFMYKASASLSTRPRNPCQVNSRWRKHSFVEADYQSKISVSKYNATTFLFSIDGIPRTVSSSFRGWFDNGTLANLPLGNYTFGWYTEEYVGGDVSINNGIDYISIYGGNPGLYLPQSLISNYNTTIKTIQLPDKQYFQNVTPASFDARGQQFYIGAGIVSTVNITDPKCQTTTSSFHLIGVFSDYDQWYYDARIVLDRNTPDKPLSDGGGMSGTLCSNVARNFLNLNKCTLTTEPSACMPFSAPKFPIFLNDTSIRLLYQGSARYVYMIRQLRTEIPYVVTPCTPYRRHRWMIINSTTCPTTTGISTETINALTAMMNDIGTWDRNSVFSDVHFEWSDYSGTYGGYTCDVTNTKTVGMMFAVNNSGIVTCYRHVHPDEGSVYDFTYWTRPDTHPGNAVAQAAGRLPPITKWADYSDAFTLSFPSWHTMDRWENNKEYFDYVGRAFDNVNFMDLPSMLRTQAVAKLFSSITNVSQAVVVCGSYGEISNNPSMTNVFSFANSGSSKDDRYLSLQKSNVWNMINLSAQDQLRQRMAWALSQILVVSPHQINEVGLSEAYLNYYDIFVRNAFGNYRDVLKEVSQSPMMAEMLSFLESKSSAYVLRNSGLTARPDENFAREMMQLFSIGVYLLNMDGTIKISPDTGLPIPTYRNSNVQTFARAWTGFLQQSQRGNIENWDGYPNRIDPMAIEPRWRDVFPKMNLYGGYIGDGYPLCSDLPRRQFLNIGAKYILLGSSSVPEYQTGDEWWAESWWTRYNTIVSLSLNRTSSALYSILCNAGTDGKCRFQPVVTLNQTVGCQGKECVVDEPRTILVSDKPPVYYEYIRPACVELSFYNDGRIVRDYQWDIWPEICANPLVDKAYEACCTGCGSWGCGGSMFCQFTGEKVLFNTAINRCSANNKFNNGGLCNWTWIDDNYSNPGCNVWSPENENWHWTNQVCTVQAKVDSSGDIAIVHTRQPIGGIMFQDYNLKNGNFFPVTWQNGSFPSPSNGCAGVCSLQSGVCICNVVASETTVFTSRPSVSDITTSLSIGAVSPTWFGASYVLTESANGVNVYQPNGTSTYSVNTLFGITVYGQIKFFKNMKSMITIGSGTNSFSARNPPHFMNFLVPDTRDVIYETDAVLDHYFYHQNVAPFISRMIIQRFGISNPSPRYVFQAATAFTTGAYTSKGITFGDGKYGNLGAMLAAIVLDREARTVILDADPSFGSMREPMIKLMGFLRAMKFQSRTAVKELSLFDLSNTIGQMPHEMPNVFSFFLPDYTPPGSIKDASLVGPEAQVQTTPTFVGFLNGIISLVDLGLTECYGGFGDRTVWHCPWYEDQASYNLSIYSQGQLRYTPTNSSNVQGIVDELALLLTSGRLSKASRKAIVDAILNASDRATGIKTAQKMFVASPTFHVTNLMQPLITEKPNMTIPTASEKPYKAVIFVNLAGGMDSYNILMPHSKCSEAGGKDLYLDYKTVRGVLALDNNTMLPINASSSNQPCKMFGVHPNMAVFQQLFKDKDLTFLANVGVLQEYVNSTNWWQKTTKTQLFAHNVQSDEISFVDIFRQAAGFGVCGRLVDTIGGLGYKASSSSVSGVAEALSSKITPLFVVDPYGIEQVNPIPWATDIVEPIKSLNKREKIGSSIYGKTWSDQLFRALGENQLLYDAFTSTILNTTFSDSTLSVQFEAVSKLIKNKNVRGVDRDVFYVQVDGFDTHSDMISSLGDRAIEINDALGSFVREMKAQGRWDDVVILFASEFARTLIPNTSSGSDHAWGGNYLIAGGNVTGGKVLGRYITDFTEKNSLIFNPGIVIPTTSWDQVWEPIAKWYGVTKESDLDYVIPSRKNFAGPLTGMFT